MPPENTAPLIAAAKARHELARSKTVRALRELARAGTPITFPTVAHTAGVSRSWLYTQTDLRDQIQQQRENSRRAPHTSIPPTQQATQTTLLHRLEAAHQRNRALTEENQRLRRQLEHALGDQRARNRNNAL
jgi:hypothetical protein